MENQEIQTAQEVQEVNTNNTPTEVFRIGAGFYQLSTKDRESALDSLQKFIDEQRIGFTWKRLWNKIKGGK